MLNKVNTPLCYISSLFQKFKCLRTFEWDEDTISFHHSIVVVLIYYIQVQRQYIMSLNTVLVHLIKVLISCHSP